MCMNQGNKNSIAIIGHTRGIGKAIADLYESKKFKVIGMSRSNGYDIVTEQEKILEQIEHCNLVVINAHAGRGQLNLLKRIYGRYSFDPKKVVVITSTSGTDEGADYNEFKVWNKFEYVRYCEIKNK